MSLLRFGKGVFPVGAHVFREPHQDMDELLADLPILKRHGFNMVKLQECWCADEPSEGNIDFTNIERIITRARELDLGIYLGLTMEMAPPWLWQKYPDCARVRSDGTPHLDPTVFSLPNDGKPGPCWDHPGARAAAERFIGELARRLGRHEHVWCWNTFQEIGIWGDGGPCGFCFCPHTLAAFRRWLMAHYGTLAALNAAWRTRYADWALIEPPRRTTSGASYADWRYFMDNIHLTDGLSMKTAALKASDPLRRPVFSHVATPGFGTGCEWRWARTGDFFGNSNYPAWWSFQGWDDAKRHQDVPHTHHLQEIWDGLMLRSDIIRCAAGPDRTFWGAEFQGGPCSTHLMRAPDPGPADIRRWMLAGLAAGMHGISFWNHRSECTWAECNGFGLLDPQGDTTPRLTEAGRLARAINRHPALFAQGSVPRARVALLVNDRARIFCQGTGDQAGQHLAYGVRGHYARLWRMGYPVDFVEATEVAAGRLTDYRAAILPVPLALDPADFRKLADYVRDGGMLISDACPGRFDTHGWCPRPQMVDGAEALFGAAHADVRLVAEPAGEPAHWTPDMRGAGSILPPTTLEGAGPLHGTSLRASFYLQTLTPAGGEAILRRGEDIAGVLNRVGKGAAVLLGTFAGHCATAHAQDAADAVFQRLLISHDVHPERVGPLLLRRRVYADQEAWFLINPTPATIRQPLEPQNRRILDDLTGDAWQPDTDTRGNVTVPGGNLACLITGPAV